MGKTKQECQGQMTNRFIKYSRGAILPNGSEEAAIAERRPSVNWEKA